MGNDWKSLHDHQMKKEIGNTSIPHLVIVGRRWHRRRRRSRRHGDGLVEFLHLVHLGDVLSLVQICVLLNVVLLAKIAILFETKGMSKRNEFERNEFRFPAVLPRNDIKLNTSVICQNLILQTGLTCFICRILGE